jgi:hypothetical protein
MAKEQNLSLNPAKISGACGRLMCCLKNEEETYEFLNAKMPRLNEEAVTADGQVGRVVELDVLRQRVRVLFEEEDTKELETFPVEELTFRGKKRRDNQQQEKKPKKEKRAKNEFGHGIGTIADQIDQLLKKGVTVKEIEEAGIKAERFHVHCSTMKREKPFIKVWKEDNKYFAALKEDSANTKEAEEAVEETEGEEAE